MLLEILMVTCLLQEPSACKEVVVRVESHAETEGLPAARLELCEDARVPIMLEWLKQNPQYRITYAKCIPARVNI